MIAMVQGKRKEAQEVILSTVDSDTLQARNFVLLHQTCLMFAENFLYELFSNIFKSNVDIN